MEEAETAAKVAKTADTAAETAATVEKMAETETAATVEKTAETETAATAATETADTAAETAATETAETAAETAATAAETAATVEKTAETEMADTAAETAATAAETAATETAETAAETAETAAETAATAAETAATAAAGAFELGKLFVGGISSETREEALEEYFGAYGELKEAVVMRDRVTGNPRGFGFIHFAGPEAADEALKAGKHVILGKTVEVKRAIPRGDLNQTDNHGSNRIPSGILTNYNFIGGNYNNGSGGGGGHYNSRKIFIGGLPESINEDEFCSYFKKFGNVTDTVIMHDSMTHRPRGFGFVTFDSPEAVENVLKSDHELNGKMVDVKKAVPKDGNNINNGIGHDNNIQSSRSFNGRRNSFVDPKCMVYPQTQSYHHMPNPNLDFVNYPGTGYMMPRGYMNGYGPYGVMYYGMPMPGPSPPWTPRWNPANNNTSNYWDMANAHHWNGNNMANKAVSYVEIPSIGSRSSSPAECGSECSVNQTG